MTNKDEETVEISPQAEFLLIATLKIALDWRKSGKGKEEFLEWCSQIWDTIDDNGAADIEKTVNERMALDLERYRKTGKIR